MLSELRDSNSNREDTTRKGREREGRELRLLKNPTISCINKENYKEIDDGVLRIINHSSLERSLQQKTQIIQRQQTEITALKQGRAEINDERDEGRTNEGQTNEGRTDEGRTDEGRTTELRQLRELERDYTDNLR